MAHMTPPLNPPLSRRERCMSNSHHIMPYKSSASECFAYCMVRLEVFMYELKNGLQECVYTRNTGFKTIHSRCAAYPICSDMNLFTCKYKYVIEKYRKKQIFKC